MECSDYWALFCSAQLHSLKMLVFFCLFFFKNSLFISVYQILERIIAEIANINITSLNYVDGFSFFFFFFFLCRALYFPCVRLLTASCFTHDIHMSQKSLIWIYPRFSLRNWKNLLFYDSSLLNSSPL